MCTNTICTSGKYILQSVYTNGSRLLPLRTARERLTPLLSNRLHPHHHSLPILTASFSFSKVSPSNLYQAICFYFFLFTWFWARLSTYMYVFFSPDICKTRKWNFFSDSVNLQWGLLVWRSWWCTWMQRRSHPMKSWKSYKSGKMQEYPHPCFQSLPPSSTTHSPSQSLLFYQIWKPPCQVTRCTQCHLRSDLCFLS